MHHFMMRFHASLHTWRTVVSEDFVALIIATLIFVVPASAAMRFQDRSLYMNSTDPGATTFYTVAFSYMTMQPVGSVDMLFCDDPIPYNPCVTPAGLDVSNAVLTDQAGEMGFSILSSSENRIVLTRPPTMITTSGSSYTFDNMINTTDTTKSFAIRLKSHGTLDASGPQIDFGTVLGQVQNGIGIETQVPPMLIFCLAEEVDDDCAGTNDTYYSDMGQLSSSSTLTAQSQMAVGTNASGGFAITANGSPLSAGTSVIDGLENPAESVPGSNQFGINLVENNAPTVGDDPVGTWANAVPSADYGIPNRYKYVSGDVVAFSPNVSLMKKFTVSYIVNSSEALRPGVYTTTITYIASGRF